MDTESKLKTLRVFFPEPSPEFERSPRTQVNILHWMHLIEIPLRFPIPTNCPQSFDADLGVLILISQSFSPQHDQTMRSFKCKLNELCSSARTPKILKN